MQSRGIRIPHDVLVACLSGTNLCKMVYPKVTAVEQNAGGMAKKAVGIILEKIAGKEISNEPVFLPAQRIDRESTQRIDS